MKREFVRSLIAAALFALASSVAGAEELSVNSILIAHKAGATSDGIIAMVSNPANTIAATPAQLDALRAEGIPETVIASIQTRVAATAPPSPLAPDDPRLVELVSLIKSGISEEIVAEQVRQSGRAFNLSVPDLLYLKQNGVLESTIGALMATQVGAPIGSPLAAQAGAKPATAPQELTFADLVLVRPAFMSKSRPGRLVMRGDSLAWVDGVDPKKNFEFQISGLEKVWLTCQSQMPENFCYQINFQIVKGAKYRFLDANQESGSNASVRKVMDALHSYYPLLAYGPPDA